MSAKLPDGATLSIAVTYGSPKTVSAITNANPGVASSTAHGMSNGALMEVLSGWNKINDRIIRVSAQATDTFALEGIDTTDTTMFPVGTGAGTVREITAFTQIAQILGFSTTGGDPTEVKFSFLDEDFERTLPSVYSAQTVKIDIADDPSLAGYIALKAASDARALRALKLSLRGGSSVIYNGIVALNETPTVTKGAVMAVTATFSLQGRPVRYAS
jgi:hypothetical protein